MVESAREKNQVKKDRESLGKAENSSFCGFRKVSLGRGMRVKGVSHVHI